MIVNIFLGCEELHMIVETPAAIANSAAINFVSIPPVPSEEPSVAVLTTFCAFRMGALLSCVVGMEHTNLPDGFDITHNLDSLSRGILARILGIQTVHVR